MVRKTHTKSRKGCVSCKRRHVKCDEQKPRCSHCVRLEIDCQYLEQRPPAHLVTYGPSPSSDTGGTASTPSFQAEGDGAPHLSIPDLKLLHFWTLNTALTCSPPNQVAIYQSVVVELGFQHTYLLHGVLAVAALHKATIYPSERNQLLHQSSLHFDAAITAYRRLLDTPDPATCVPVFMLSGMLHVHLLASAQINPPVDTIADICTWMRIIRGVRSTVHPNWERLKTSEVAPMLQGLNRDKIDKTQSSEVLQLKQLANQVPDTKMRDVYLQAIDDLHVVMLNVRAISLDDEERWTMAITLSWAALTPPEFIEFLAAHDQVALVILSYYAVLFELSKRQWWMYGWSKYAQEAVHQHLDPDLLKWTEWPRQQLEIQLGSDGPGGR